MCRAQHFRTGGTSWFILYAAMVPGFVAGDEASYTFTRNRLALICIFCQKWFYFAADRSTRTAHCLKFGSREIGSNAPSVTRFEFVSAK